MVPCSCSIYIPITAKVKEHEWFACIFYIKIVIVIKGTITRITIKTSNITRHKGCIVLNAIKIYYYRTIIEKVWIIEVNISTNP